MCKISGQYNRPVVQFAQAFIEEKNTNLKKDLKIKLNKNF